MNKAISIPIAIIIVLIVFTISIGLILLGYIYWPKFTTESSSDYYDNLRNKYCYKDSVSKSIRDCCLESVVVMEEYGYKMAENNSCPDNYKGPIMAMCDGAIPFCVPPSEPIISIDDCFKLKDEGSFFNPEVHSNVPKDEVDYINEETRKVDYCIFYFVDQHEEIIDDSVCENIVSPYYIYLCRQRIVFHSGDVSLCNIEYLGKQSNVDGCLNHFSNSEYVDPDPHTESINP